MCACTLFLCLDGHFLSRLDTLHLDLSVLVHLGNLPVDLCVRIIICGASVSFGLVDLTPWLDLDTFGVVCFAVQLVGWFIWYTWPMFFIITISQTLLDTL